jgi:cytochrome c553
MALSLTRCAALPVAALLFVGAAPAAAGDIQAGREAAQVCVPCHGLDGLSKAMNAANIAGQLELYLIEQLKAYRSGARKHEQMSIVAEPLTDKEIADIAAYYAAIKVQVTLPE